MQIFVGESKLFFDGGKIYYHIGERYKIDPREIGASYDCHNSTVNATCVEGIGTFWMVVNNKTLQLVDYVWCQTTASAGEGPARSKLAYVDVIDPAECIPSTTISVQSTYTSYNVPTSTNTPNMTSGVLLSNYNIRHAQTLSLLSFSTLVYCALFVTV